MLKVRQDDTGYWQGFKMTFKKWLYNICSVWRG